ncbi:hypothetical protein B0H12DRAFT_1068912 [Mycena haematopus]|nr:hypothetical protein B0H12DRAFT_1068912 [Mycena haematopus]
MATPLTSSMLAPGSLMGSSAAAQLPVSYAERAANERPPFLETEKKIPRGYVLVVYIIVQQRILKSDLLGSWSVHVSQHPMWPNKAPAHEQKRNGLIVFYPRSPAPTRAIGVTACSAPRYDKKLIAAWEGIGASSSVEKARLRVATGRTYLHRNVLNPDAFTQAHYGNLRNRPIGGCALRISDLP